jgi:hypothetical protein
MNAHCAEVMFEAWLHEGAGGLVKRLAGRAQNFVDDRWGERIVLGFKFRGLGLSLQAFLAALVAFAARSRSSAAGALTLEKAAAHWF